MVCRLCGVYFGKKMSITQALNRRYHRLRMSRPFSGLILMRGVRALRRLSPPTEPLERSLAGALRRDGIALSSMGELFPDGELWRAMQEEAESYKRRYEEDPRFREEI